MDWSQKWIGPKKALEPKADWNQKHTSASITPSAAPQMERCIAVKKYYKLKKLHGKAKWPCSYQSLEGTDAVNFIIEPEYDLLEDYGWMRSWTLRKFKPHA